MDLIKQLGELDSNEYLSDVEKEAMLKNMLKQAYQRHFEATINGAWQPAKLEEAKAVKGMIDTLLKQLAAVQARLPKDEKP